ncbi:MAG: alanine/glycine:cation symporter family protein [Eubacteriales bacterium]
MGFFDALQLMLAALILCGGIYFVVYLRAFFLRHPIKTVCAMMHRSDKNGISPLRALSASLSGTLGVGNIVGVAVAIIIGGAGAVFWIWISALFSMVLKYCEIVLGVKYRRKSGKGFLGGPMYYMEDGIGGKTGRICALVFAFAGVVSSFALGNVVQISAASDAAKFIFGFPEAAFGIISAILISFVIFGDFDRISRVTSIVLPIMSGAYLFLSVAVILRNAAMIPSIFGKIMREAFKTDSACGGILGFFLSKNVLNGISKGTFSHESGSGTAPMAHANAETDMPARQGTFGLMEVTIDTLIICTVSSLVILVALEKGIAEENGMALVLSSFESDIGAWSGYIIGISIILFAFSTLICWAFYGKSCLLYITSSKTAQIIYLIIYLFFAAFGAVMSQSVVWHTADAGMALMTTLNMPALFIMRKEIKRETELIF